MVTQGGVFVQRVAVTGAAGQIAYSLLFRLANGDLFGKEEPIELYLLEVEESLPLLEGVVMELQDVASSSLKRVVFTSKADEAFEGVDYAFLVGAKPRGPGMERKDLLKENAKIFIEQGAALDRRAKRAVKVLVVGNPCNTNCLIALRHAPSLDPRQFQAMMRLDCQRLQAQLAIKAGVSVQEVEGMVVWGNHSSTLVPDFSRATISKKPVKEVIRDPLWLEQLAPLIQQRGAQVIAKRGKSSAASAAAAAIAAMRAWITPTPKGEWYSAALLAEGNPYGIDPGVVFSFPCRTREDGQVEIIEGWDLKVSLRETEEELKQERALL